jgi:DNA-directed RNA polymerase specialized sigma24 family protein
MSSSRVDRARREGTTTLDEDAFRNFVQAEYGRLVGALTAVSGSRMAAEDAVQEAMVRVWEHMRQVKSSRHRARGSRLLR